MSKVAIDGEMKSDPIFKERFGISTPIIYSHDVIVDPKWKAQYNKAWKKFRKEFDLCGSVRRHQRFDKLLKRIEELGDDLPFTKMVDIRFINKDVGYGVFAKQYIPPYTLLNHYGGILKNEKAIAENNDSTFMFSNFPDYSIDAAKVGNWCRFMNHSETGTNVIAWEHYSDWGPRILFTSGRKGIRKGQQLLYSYGDSYWDEEGFEEL